MISSNYSLTRYDADEGCVFDWKEPRYETDEGCIILVFWILEKVFVLFIEFCSLCLLLDTESHIPIFICYIILT